jgi:N-acetylglutamate synthase-like GNAT family acetyltransferase
MLLRCVEDSEAVIAESVVVAERVRGRGYGRVIMELMHAQAQSLGFQTVYLCTRDKRDFYQHLGYEVCSAVTPKTAASELIDSSAVNKLKGVFGGGDPTQSEYLWLKISLL